MTDEQRDQLYRALLGDVSMMAETDPARLMLEKTAAQSVNDIEPIVAGFLKQAIRETGLASLSFSPMSIGGAESGAGSVAASMRRKVPREVSIRLCASTGAGRRPPRTD